MLTRAPGGERGAKKRHFWPRVLEKFRTRVWAELCTLNRPSKGNECFILQCVLSINSSCCSLQEQQAAQALSGSPAPWKINFDMRIMKPPGQRLMSTVKFSLCFDSHLWISMCSWFRRKTTPNVVWWGHQ